MGGQCWSSFALTHPGQHRCRRSALGSTQAPCTLLQSHRHLGSQAGVKPCTAHPTPAPSVPAPPALQSRWEAINLQHKPKPLPTASAPEAHPQPRQHRTARASVFHISSSAGQALTVSLLIVGETWPKVFNLSASQTRNLGRRGPGSVRCQHKARAGPRRAGWQLGDTACSGCPHGRLHPANGIQHQTGQTQHHAHRSLCQS